MKLKTTLPLLSFLFLIHFTILAQQGYLHIRIYGSKSPLCLLDSTRLNTADTVLALSPGRHWLKVWKPTMMLIDSSVNIRSGDTAKYSFMLKHTPQYIAYKKARLNYIDARNKRLFVSPIIMGLAVGTGLAVNKILTEKRYDKLIDIRSTYQSVSTQSQIEEQKVLFEAELKKYRRLKKVEYGFYSVAGLVAINYVRIVIKQRRTPVPQYSEQKLLSGINFNMYPDMEKKVLMCGLTMKF